MQIIQEYWFFISGVLIPASTFFIGKYKQKAKELDGNIVKLSDGMCAMQRHSLLESCEEYLKRGFATMEQKETLNELYKSYHDLGGDSFITDMVRQVNELPLMKEK